MDLLSSINNQKTVSEFSEQAYLKYSMYVILDRALPHISDGLKPVQRRIIYAMCQIGLSHLARYKKSARTVGDVLGKYHPHSDSACYEAMVLMAQDFSYRYPLIDGQGNWGSIDNPKSFAAMRYTESRLSKYAVLLISELEQGSVDWVKNFDGTLYEPKLLPAQVPNILLNGAMGIAVGMSTYIPPHNISEIINACLYLISNPKSRIQNILNIVNAPDYPGGANIISSKEEIAEVYKSGVGYIKQQARYNFNSNSNIIITKLPHQVSSSNVINQIVNQIKQKKIPWIQNIQDESDDKEPVKIVLYSNTNKKNIKKLMSHLLATTNLEKSFYVNMNVIGLNNRPKIKNLLEIIQEWIEYFRLSLRRRIMHKLDKVSARLHILKGLLIAFINIDKVIEIIRKYYDPSVELQKRLKLHKIQVEAILNIKLRKLEKIEEIEIIKEQKKLQKEQDLLKGYLNSEIKFRNLMKKELKQTLNNFGDNRRSKIIAVEKSQALQEKDIMSSEKVTVLLSKDGWLRCAKGDNINLTNLRYKPKDSDKLSAVGQTHSIVIFFTNYGQSYSVYVDKIPSARGYGEHITTYIPIDSKVEIIGMGFASSKLGFLLISLSGKGFIAPTQDLISKKTTGKNIFNANDVCSFIEYLNKNYKAIIVTTYGRIVIRSYHSFSLFKRSKGKSIISLDKKDQVKYVKLFDLEVQELILYSGRKFLRIGNKNINRYFTDKISGGGVLLPQGFRKVTQIQVKEK